MSQSSRSTILLTAGLWLFALALIPAAASPAKPAIGDQPQLFQAARSHWAFQPLHRPDPPRVKYPARARNPIDSFVLKRLETSGLGLSAAADRRTLIRRVSYGLTGLPPTPAEVDAFLNDESSDAFEKVVERLLASRHYGEHWGRHWLDLARYADTRDFAVLPKQFPFAYTYRDYVIRAFNEDLPYDRFILEQLAADLLDLGDDKRALAAMGFLTVGRQFVGNEFEIIDDRIDVVTRPLLGLTVTCARCHDHKFEPIGMEDYYGLFGVFASSVEPFESPRIETSPDDPKEKKHLTELQEKVRAVDAHLRQIYRNVNHSLRSQVTDYLVYLAKDQALPSGDKMRLAALKRWQTFLNEPERGKDPIFAPWHRLMATNDADLNPLVRQALVEAKPDDKIGIAKALGKLFAGVYADWTKLQQGENPPDRLSDPNAEALRRFLYADGSPTSWTFSEVRRASLVIPLPQLKDALVVLRGEHKKLTKLRGEVEKLHIKYVSANKGRATPRAMALREAEMPANAPILLRGDPARPGRIVPRRFLKVLSGVDGNQAFTEGSGRLQLARAIVSPKNPLTARVMVNRIWRHHFGAALVSTTSNFGLNGRPPTHPELLDYLAARFIDSGWSIKDMHRLILASAAYQQASTHRADGAKVDPGNELYWRMNRQRLEFEPLRDSLLAVAGRLDRSVSGGPPVDLVKHASSGARTVFGLIDRQNLPGMFRTFDFASPDLSTATRRQTTVAQQALYMMNSPFVRDQARQLAARPEMVRESDPRDRIRALYRRIFNRPPDETELADGLAFVRGENETEAWPRYAQGLLMLNEFIYLD